jgi:hypothetical protein
LNSKGRKKFERKKKGIYNCRRRRRKNKLKQNTIYWQIDMGKNTSNFGTSSTYYRKEF